MWDAEGRRYIDLVQSYGAIIAGHAHPAIVEAVQRAAADGTSYGAPTEREVQLAEAITARVPSVELVRLVSSGTEATMSAIRVARGHTGRRKVVKFAGNYHGHGDLLLAEAGSGLAALGLPGSAGVTDAAVSDTRRRAVQPGARARRRHRVRHRRARSPPTWASSRPTTGSSRACAPSATGSAPCWCSTR